MNLAIDVGNTSVKVALFESDSLFWQDSFDKELLLDRLEKIQKKQSISRAIIASVASISKKQLEEIHKLFPISILNSESNVAFQNKYATPKTLGVDRIALVAAAYKKYPKRNVLIIDAGTCITYDLLNEQSIYNGGSISPGIQMRFKALHTFTDKLPLLQKSEEVELIGDSTKSAMQSGVVNGVVAEINGIVDAYNLEFRKLTVVLTGGDAYFLANRLKNGIFANPNFLLEGLNSILIHNCKDD